MTHSVPLDTKDFALVFSCRNFSKIRIGIQGLVLDHQEEFCWYTSFLCSGVTQVHVLTFCHILSMLSWSIISSKDKVIVTINMHIDLKALISTLTWLLRFVTRYKNRLFSGCLSLLIIHVSY